MRSRKLSDAAAQLTARSERKIEDPWATSRGDFKAANVIPLTLANSGRDHASTLDGPLGCQIELLEEFLEVFKQEPNVSMPE